MQTLSIILLTLAALIVLEGFVLTIWPLEIKKVLSKILRNKKLIRKMGLIEVVVGIILIVIVLLVIGLLVG